MAGVADQSVVHEDSVSTSTTKTSASSSSSGGGRMNRWNRVRRWPESVVEDRGTYNSSCGYCKSESQSSQAHGLSAHRLSVQDYQDLLDRGWRRSGTFLYKPCMKETCCPPYTIRLNAESFVASKDQTRVWRRMERYLAGTYNGPQTVGELHEEKDNICDRDEGVPSDTIMASVSNRNCSISKGSPVEGHETTKRNAAESIVHDEDAVTGTLKFAIESALTKSAESGLLTYYSDLLEVSVKRIPPKLKGKLKGMEGEADYTSNVGFALAASLRRKQKTDVQVIENSMVQQGAFLESKPHDIAETLAKILSEMAIPGVVSAKACKGHLNFLMADVYMSPQQLLTQEGQASKVNAGKSGEIGTKEEPAQLGNSTGLGVGRHLEIRMNKSCFDAAEFALYKKYQMVVHNDQPENVREGSYRRFLVETPLNFVESTNNGTTPPCGFGSFHQQYLIDGRLVAVGVVDILPKCLSSKYLFWDPDFAFLALGKYSALQEIKWVQQMQQFYPSLEYYYMGFYIHSCPKMRYKAAYYPSELLCPERYRWVAYEQACSILEVKSYACLSDIDTTTRMKSVPSSGAREQEAVTALSGNGNKIHLQDRDVCEVEFISVEDGVACTEGESAEIVKDTSGKVDDVLLCLHGTFMPFKHLKLLGPLLQQQLFRIEQKLVQYVEDVGPQLTTRMAFVMQ